jgi:hypothetical protein
VRELRRGVYSKAGRSQGRTRLSQGRFRHIQIRRRHEGRPDRRRRPFQACSNRAALSDKQEDALIDLLQANCDVFAWKPTDMSRISREFVEHSLNIQPTARSVTQRLRRFDEEKCKAIGEEVARLMAVGFTREMHHPMSAANPVLVKKRNVSWRMCVDYTRLDKACPKDRFPLPRIDRVMESTVGCELLSFLDAYSGYHFHYPLRHILLRLDVVRPEERRSYVPEVHALLLRRPSRA